MVSYYNMVFIYNKYISLLAGLPVCLSSRSLRCEAGRREEIEDSAGGWQITATLVPWAAIRHRRRSAECAATAWTRVLLWARGHAVGQWRGLGQAWLWLGSSCPEG